MLVLAGLVEAVAWLAVWGMTITRAADGEASVVDVLSACGMAAIWVRPSPLSTLLGSMCMSCYERAAGANREGSRMGIGHGEGSVRG